MKKLYFVFAFVLALSTTGQAQSNLGSLAVELLNKMPASGYVNRQLCISGDTVVGTYGIEGWAVRGLATGTTNNFPASLEPITASVTVPFKINYPTGPDDWKNFTVLEGNTTSGIFLSSGTVGSSPASVCVFESRPVLE